MFYIKTKRGHHIPIEDGECGNVFTTCPDCGREFEVELSDLIVNDNIDVYGTQLYCTECTANHKRV